MEKLQPSGDGGRHRGLLIHLSQVNTQRQTTIHTHITQVTKLVVY